MLGWPLAVRLAGTPGLPASLVDLPPAACSGVLDTSPSWPLPKSFTLFGVLLISIHPSTTQRLLARACSSAAHASCTARPLPLARLRCGQHLQHPPPSASFTPWRGSVVAAPVAVLLERGLHDAEHLRHLGLVLRLHLRQRQVAHLGCSHTHNDTRETHRYLSKLTPLRLAKRVPGRAVDAPFLCLLRRSQYERFFTSFSDRPGSSLAISTHLDTRHAIPSIRNSGYQ